MTDIDDLKFNVMTSPMVEFFKKPICDALDELKALQAQQPTTQFEKWISVKDRLPDSGEYKKVLVAWNERSVDTYYGCYVYERIDTSDDYHITHWMPLPEVPESEVNNER